MKATRPDQITVSEATGLVAGYSLGLITGLFSRIRRARMFHPRGILLVARMSALPNRHTEAPGPLFTLAERLSGPVLIRFSSAWWKNRREWIDVLGCAIRFTQGEPRSPEPAPRDQDLLFATIRYPWTTPFAPLSTRQHDFLANDYYAVSPFQIDGRDLVKLRLRPWDRRGGRARAEEGSRLKRLLKAIEMKRAFLSLEVLELGRKEEGWKAISKLELIASVEMDQARLRFDPFRSGRGIRPRGFIQYLRVGAYKISQKARPARSKTGPVPIEDGAGSAPTDAAAH